MRVALLATLLTTVLAGQGTSPQTRAFLSRPNPFSAGSGAGRSANSGLARIPIFVFGGTSTLNGIGANGTARSGISLFGGNGYLLNPSFGGFNGYYYWTPQSQSSTAPSGPSYANPGVASPVADLPPALQAPERPGGTTEEWLDARSSFNAASAKVSSARLAVEELRSRLSALGQSPRAMLITQTANAEAALKSAQEQMAAGKLEDSAREIQRANYIAGQVLKEFGR